MNTVNSISEYINDHDISLSELSEKSGIAEAMIDSMLDGTKQMTVDELRAICIALDVSADEFVNRKSEVTHNEASI